jgi:protein phosphatase PTC2/3
MQVTPLPSIERINVQAFVSQGGRGYQEDRAVFDVDLNRLIPNMNRDNVIRRSFYGIFDGHGGSLVSDFLAQEFPKRLVEHKSIVTNPGEALKDVWMQMDDIVYDRCQTYADQFKALSGEMFPCDGSTATVVLIIGTEIYVSNCGDSSCHYFTANGESQCLSETHSTSSGDEPTRCVNAGGTLRDQKGWTNLPAPLCCIPYYGSLGKPRIFPGGLLVTRAFGDFHAKKPALGGKPLVVIADHGRIAVLRMGDIKYLVLASDGVWDALSTKDVFAAISKPQMKPKVETSLKNLANIKGLIGNVRDLHIGGDAPNCAEQLCEKAVKSTYWYKEKCPADNTSCIILEFNYTV